MTDAVVTPTTEVARSGWTHGKAGKAVKDGKVNYFSASALQTADSSTETGCLRAYIFKYVHGIKEPETEQMRLGTQFHSEIESYLRTGVRNLSAQVLAGMHMIPDPGPDLFIEHSLVPLGADGKEDLAAAPLHVAGIPFLGKIDLLHARGTNQGASDIEDTHNEGILEVVDWKSTGDLRYIKSASDLPKTIQMASYAKYVFAVEPSATKVRLSHAYFPKRGTPRKVTTLVTRDTIEPTWNHMQALGAQIIEAVKETDPNNVPANTNACRAYGRECPAKVAGMCKAAAHNSLSSFIGQTAAADVLNAVQTIGAQMGQAREATALVTGSLSSNESHLQTECSPIPATSTMTTPSLIAPGSLLAHVRATAPIAAVAAPTATPVPANAPTLLSFGQAPAATAPPAPDATAIASEVARLRTKEYDAKYPGLALRLAAIEACGLGMPMLTGELAAAYAGLQGRVLDGDGVAGSGMLAQFTFADPNQINDGLVQQAQDIQARMAAQGAPQLPAPAPAPAPAPTVAVAEARPKRKPGRPKADATPPAQAPYVPATVAPVVAGPQVEMPATVAVTATVPQEVTLVIPPEPPAIPAPIVQSVPADPVAVAYVPTGINFFVDVVVDGMPTINLWPTVYALLDEMHKKSGKTDFRLSDRDSVFSYNGYKGILASMIKQTPIPPGNYVLDGSFGDISAVVIEAMREMVYRSKGVFVRGVR